MHVPLQSFSVLCFMTDCFEKQELTKGPLPEESAGNCGSSSDETISPAKATSKGLAKAKAKGKATAKGKAKAKGKATAKGKAKSKNYKHPDHKLILAARGLRSPVKPSRPSFSSWQKDDAPDSESEEETEKEKEPKGSDEGSGQQASGV